ncbi:MAG: rod shape-determining protein MreC [Myxococcaceae bacterium]
MLSLIKRYRDLLVISFLLLYPFVTFLATRNKPRDPNVVDRIVVSISSPLQYGLTVAVDSLVGGWQGYVALRGVREQGQVLQAENARLRAELNNLTEARAENERLKRLLSYTETAPRPPIAARVVGVNPVQNMLSLHINRGESAGVRKGLPVMTADGVVGRVLRATGSSADVLLITDPNSHIAVRVQRSRYRATATGARDKTGLPLVLENALRTGDIEEGDTLITSGTDGVFPPGLVVGKVSNVERKNYGMFMAARITPAVDVTAVEELLVLPDNPLGEVVPPGGLVQ